MAKTNTQYRKNAESLLRHVLKVRDAAPEPLGLATSSTSLMLRDRNGASPVELVTIANMLASGETLYLKRGTKYQAWTRFYDPETAGDLWRLTTDRRD